MSRKLRPASVRFYFDADLLGVAKVIASLRNDVTYPGDPGAVIHKRQRPPCVITSPETLDTDWIPTVSGLGWIIITRDLRIVQNIAERRAIKDARGRMVALAGREAGTIWAQLEILLSRWRSIEDLANLPGPFAYRASRSALSAVELP